MSMPSDSRRIPAPEGSLNLDELIQRDEVDSFDGKTRKDGRSCDESRPIFLKSGIIPQAQGSAYIEMGKTKVICAVYGPRDFGRKDSYQMKGALKCEFKFAPFSCGKRRGHVPDDEEMEYSQVMTQSLEPAVMMDKFPKSQVDVYAYVLENDGGCLAAAITAASLALTDASIEMYDMVAACNIRLHGKDTTIHDPTAREEYDRAKVTDEDCDNHGNVTIALLPQLNQVSGMLSLGVIDCDVLSEATKLCNAAAQEVYTVLQKAVFKSYGVSSK